MSKRPSILSSIAIVSLSAGCIFGGSSEFEPRTDAGAPNNVANDGGISCGNGIIENGETCDGDCPASCDDEDACTADNRTGSESTCDVVCVNSPIDDCGADMGPLPDAGDPSDMGVGTDLSQPSDTGSGPDMGGPIDTDTGGPADMSSTADMAADLGTPLQGFVIFDDVLAPDVTFSGFGQSNSTGSPSQVESFSGTTSLEFQVPATGFTGSAYVSNTAVDLSSYDALRFMVKASKSATIDSAGFGRTAVSTDRAVGKRSFDVTTSWQEVIIPIPVAARVSNLTGLFYLTENADEGAYSIYIDEIAFVNMAPGDLAGAVGEFNAASLTLVPQQTVQVSGTRMSVDVLGQPETFLLAPYYFDWASSDGSVAMVDSMGNVATNALGQASITGSLNGTPAIGALDIEVVDSPQAPAPAPVTQSADVIAAIYSGAYTEVPNNTLGSDFGDTLNGGTQSEIQIAGNDTLVYSDLGFIAILVEGQYSLDLSGATTMHVDIWTSNTTSYGIKLVDFGPNNTFDGVGQGDDSEYNLNLSAPADFERGRWVRHEIPLSRYDANGLTGRANISQIIFGTNTNAGATVLYVDNLYFY